MNTILIDSPTLAKLIEQNPQTKIDILNNAIPQLAQLIATKFREENVSAKLDSTLREQLDKIRYGNMTVGQKDGFKKIVQEIWASEIREKLEIEARRIAEEIAGRKIGEMLDTVRDELGAARLSAQEELGAYARQAAEREVLALLRSGGLVAAPAA